MRRRLYCIISLLCIPYLEGKDPDLPLCPTNIQFFPQNLPMHCRMPSAADLQNLQTHPHQTLPSFSPPFYQRPGKEPETVPSGISGPIPMPGPIPIPGPIPMPGPIGMPMPGPVPISGAMPMPMPMPGSPGPAHKLPVIVMPFYSPDNSFKKQQPGLRPDQRKKFHNKKRRPRHRYYTDTDDSSETDTSSNDVTDTSESEGWWNGRRATNSRHANKHRREKRRRRQRQELLTPILQYITKDGYVIFEKKISNGEVKDWLKVKANSNIETTTYSKQEIDEFEEIDNVQAKHNKEEDKLEMRTEINTLKHHKRKKHRQLKKVEE